MDANAFEKLAAAVDYPMVVVTAAAGDERDGCLVGFATQASIDPPRLLVCLSDKNRTYRIAVRSDYLAVHYLAEDNGDLAELFGSETGDEVDKFTQCSWRPGPGDVPLVDGTNGWAVIRVVTRYVMGDHVGFLGDVVDADCSDIRLQLGFQAARGIDPGHEP
jgi:flavin reductase (DIM6/NTAB) family NADH-FMN oxidoreductase RutF